MAEPAGTQRNPVARIAARRFRVTANGSTVQLPPGPGIRTTQSLHVVPGVGHDHKAMYMSACGLRLLFGDGRCRHL